MPCSTVERSPDLCIGVLKLWLDQLGLSYGSRAEHRRIHRVLHDLQKNHDLDLVGYHFGQMTSGEWHSEQLELDLCHLAIIDPVQQEFHFTPEVQPWDGRQLPVNVVHRLQAYRPRIQNAPNAPHG